MTVLKESGRNVYVLQTSLFDGATDQPHRISPTTSGAADSIQQTADSIQQTAERISDANLAALPSGNDAGISDLPTAIAEITSSSRFFRDNDEFSSRLPQLTSYVQDQEAPSVISQHELPTYTQASLSGDGAAPSGHPSPASEFSMYLPDPTLPDILYSHIMPRLPPVVPSPHRQQRTRHRHEESHNRGSRHRHRVNSVDGAERQRRHSSWTRSTSSSQMHEGSCKEPCVKCMVTVTSFRWVLVVLSVLGVACVVTGIVLASLHAAGQSFLFLAIMFIGLGVLLVIVVGVGWKCTPRGHEPLHALFGIGGFMHRRSRGRRHRRHRNRDRNWLGGIMYPEFQFRRPPPSYAASMQDYHSQVSTEPNEGSSPRSPAHNSRASPPSSPPPSYRSRTSTCHSGILNAFPNINNEDETTSRPPTYRSHASSHRPSFPREYRFEHNRSDLELGMSPASELFPAESSGRTTASASLIHEVTESSGCSTASASLIHEVTESSELQTHSNLPVAGPSAQEELSHSVSSSLQPPFAVSKDRPSSPETRNETNNHKSINVSENPQNSVSDVSSRLSSTVSLESRREARPSSLLERMDSEDRLTLEQTLQSLDQIDDGGGGVTNEGAVFDDLTQ